MQNNLIILWTLSISSMAFIFLTLLERHKRVSTDEKNRRLEGTIRQLDEQAKIIIKTDLALNRVQEDLDRKITGLYTLHELGKKINATFNIEDLFGLINKPLVLKVGFSKALIMLKDKTSDKISVKTSVGYESKEIEEIEKAIDKNKAILSTQLLKKGGFLLVNRDLKKIAYEDMLSSIFKTESFITVPIVVKDEPIGFILMGNSSSYTKVTEGDSELLSVLSSQIGSAIENSGLYTELFNSHQDLERRVKERTSELAELNEQLKKLNKMKSDFVSAVSHELRTPLTSIKGYASILVAGKLGSLTKVQKERLEKIDKHSNNLTKLVNNMLDISRIESGKVQMMIKETSLKEMIDSVVDIMTPQIKEKNLDLSIDIKTVEDKIKADASQLERVFINLVSNAVKFTPEKGKISITAKYKNNFMEFTIKDTGIGMTEEDAKKIFEEFFRAKSALDENIKGTGLGLSLVKKIIDAHGGTISVESSLGNGTAFKFTIPKI